MKRYLKRHVKLTVLNVKEGNTRGGFVKRHPLFFLFREMGMYYYEPRKWTRSTKGSEITIGPTKALLGEPFGRKIIVERLWTRLGLQDLTKRA